MSFNNISKIFFVIFHFFLNNSKKARKLFFETSGNNFILSEGKEIFIVSTSDQVIAKSIYVKRKFDIDKFFIAKNILNLKLKNITFIDIGANVGSICIPLVNRNLVEKAIAIEPDPLNFKLLKANITLNSLEDKIIPIEKALGKEKRGNINFELSKLNHGDHRVHTGKNDQINDDEKNRKIINVEVTNLDLIIQSYQSEDYFIWMDTQGYEGYILEGAPFTMNKGYPLVMEFWPHGMSGSRAYEILKKSLSESSYIYFYNLNEKIHQKIVLNESNLDALFKKLSIEETHTDLLLTI